MMMLQFDELESQNSNVFSNESEIQYTEKEFIESSNEDDILIPNMKSMLEDLFFDFNNINSGSLFHLFGLTNRVCLVLACLDLSYPISII